MSAAVSKRAPGVISAAEAYRGDELMRRLGVGRQALVEMRRRGLTARKIGKRLLFHGQDVLDFISEAEPAERPSAAKE